MAYSRVSTPRFFIDLPLFTRYHNLSANLSIYDESSIQGGLLNLNPSKSNNLILGYTSSGGIAQYHYSNITLEYYDSCWLNSVQYFAILGHKFSSLDLFGTLYYFNTDNDVRYFNRTLETVNCNVDFNSFGYGLIHPESDGWSLIRFNKLYEDLWKIRFLIGAYTGGDIEQDFPFQLGDLSYGWTFDMPHSADLSLKLSYQNESIKKQTTKSGATLTSAGYTEPPYWLDKPQWMLADEDDRISNYKGVSPSSKRVWDLSFSYIEDTDLLNENYNGQSAKHFGVLEAAKFGADMQQVFGIKDSFFAKVFHGTCNFKNPFIFQPDKDVQEYAIARIDSNSFTIQQQALNVYSVSMTIYEVF